MSLFESLVQRNLAALAQGGRLLDRLDDAAYAGAAPRLGAAGLGVHLRHVLDFHEQFLRGLPGGRIDYDARRREGTVAASVARGRERLDELAAAVEGLAAPEPGARLLVRLDDRGEGDWTGSTVERELQALLSHTVHHFAIVALLLRDQGIEPEDGFGVADATLRYWKEAGRCAP